MSTVAPLTGAANLNHLDKTSTSTPVPTHATAPVPVPGPVAAVSAPKIVDDKSPHVIPFILNHYRDFRAAQQQSSSSSSSTLATLTTTPTPTTTQTSHPAPFIIGLSGPQGCGKTTLVSGLENSLRDDHGLEVLVFSLDDLYLRHEDQVALVEVGEGRGNRLVRRRGEPGTHDIPLASSIFTSLLTSSPTAIPRYSKSLFSGAGDRLPPSASRLVNPPHTPPLDIVIFEGWMVGFRALSEQSVKEAWEGSLRASQEKEEEGADDDDETPAPNLKTAATAKADSTVLWKYRLEELQFINHKLAAYDIITDTFDAFVHVDAQEIGWVFGWREEAERALRESGGGGMSVEEVRAFVEGYLPGYELWNGGVRRGVFLKGREEGEEGKDGRERGRQIRLVVGWDRRVKEVVVI